jgi:Uncharacterized protein conserved in bacteria (DUF2252)
MNRPEAGTGQSEYVHQGERVVKGQLLTQAASDPFLGWTSGIGTSGTPAGGDGHHGLHGAAKDYYVPHTVWARSATCHPAFAHG